MKLAWVRGFVAVADAGGFAEAAEQLFTTQSTVSKQIQSLEKELGVTLFDRTGRRAALSPAGRALLPHARRLLREEQALRAAAAQQGEGGSASLRIASIPIAAGCGFTAIAASFARANPHIRLTLDERETGALSAALDGGYDFAADAFGTPQTVNNDTPDDREININNINSINKCGGEKQVSPAPFKKKFEF